VTLSINQIGGTRTQVGMNDWFFEGALMSIRNFMAYF